MHEHHLTISRTARYYTLGEPGPAVHELWIACHGYGQLAAEFLARMTAVQSPTRLVVAPEGLSRFYLERARGGSHSSSAIGASWMTREDRNAEIGDQVAYLDVLAQVFIPPVSPSAVKLTVLGFSQGVATACRWLVHSRARAHRLVCWGGLVPDDVLRGDVGALRHTKICLVAGSRDEFVGADRVATAAAALQALGLDVTSITFHGGHRLDDATLGQLVASDHLS